VIERGIRGGDIVAVSAELGGGGGLLDASCRYKTTAKRSVPHPVVLYIASTVNTAIIIANNILYFARTQTLM
jgi:hypothetical protein